MMTEMPTVKIALESKSIFHHLLEPGTDHETPGKDEGGAENRLWNGGNGGGNAFATFALRIHCRCGSLWLYHMEHTVHNGSHLR